LLAARIRSNIVEATHEGALAVVTADGELIAHDGDIERPFFLRSAEKPFQAVIAQTEGAALRPVELALAAASHDGEPVHVAIVESMLGEVGLDASRLRCPPSWPLSSEATRRLQNDGERGPRSVLSNCSGKHAAWLRSCLARGWPLDSYLSPEHPLQTRITSFVAELAGEATQVGVDGCGAPVLATTTRVMAHLYALLASSPELSEVRTVMHRYPALISGANNGEAVIASSLDAVAKRGAAGCLGVALESGIGLAVKAWDGSQEAAVVAMVAALTSLGRVPATATMALESYAVPPVFGGGEVVGRVEPRIDLNWS
jgi:L-asparaginase II